MRSSFILVVALLSACDATDAERVAAACSTLCSCEEAPLPAAQDRCIAQCTEEAIDDADAISDQCLACISGHETCATLERDCAPACQGPEPDDPVLVDGGMSL